MEAGKTPLQKLSTTMDNVFYKFSFVTTVVLV